MSDIPAAPPRMKANTRLGMTCLVIGLLVCFIATIYPHWELQGPILRGTASGPDYAWYFFVYSLPGLCGLIALIEGFRVRRRNPERARHDDVTPVTMAMAAVLVFYSLIDSLMFFVV